VVREPSESAVPHQAKLSGQPQVNATLSRGCSRPEDFAESVPNPPRSGEDAQRISPLPQKQYQSPRKMPRLLS